VEQILIKNIIFFCFTFFDLKWPSSRGKRTVLKKIIYTGLYYSSKFSWGLIAGVNVNVQDAMIG
jgi:hypothetical protein